MGNQENKYASSNSTSLVEEGDAKSGDKDMLLVSLGLDHLVDSWIMDSTCSYHMTPNKEKFNTYMLVSFSSILM